MALPSPATRDPFRLVSGRPILLLRKLLATRGHPVVVRRGRRRHSVDRTRRTSTRRRGLLGGRRRTRKTVPPFGRRLSTGRTLVGTTLVTHLIVRLATVRRRRTVRQLLHFGRHCRLFARQFVRWRRRSPTGVPCRRRRRRAVPRRRSFALTVSVRKTRIRTVSRWKGTCGFLRRRVLRTGWRPAFPVVRNRLISGREDVRLKTPWFARVVAVGATRFTW